MINGKIDTLTILIFAAVLIMLFLGYIIYTSIFGGDRSDREAKRLKQLKKQEARKAVPTTDTEKYKDMVDKVTQPLIDTILKNYKDDDFYKLSRKLYITGAYKIWSPISWYATIILCIAIGIVCLLLFWDFSEVFAITVCAVFLFFPSWLLNNEYNNINDNMLLHFPDVIRTTAGYLSSGLILPRAFEETSRSASKRWKPILEGYVERCSKMSMSEALEWMKDQVDVPQARQFFTTVKLSIDSNIDAKDSFLGQAAFIDDLLDDARQKKLESREIIGNIMMPLLVALLIAAYALPLVGQIMESGFF